MFWEVFKPFACVFTFLTNFGVVSFIICCGQNIGIAVDFGPLYSLFILHMVPVHHTRVVRLTLYRVQLLSMPWVTWRRSTFDLSRESKQIKMYWYVREGTRFLKFYVHPRNWLHLWDKHSNNFGLKVYFCSGLENM